MLYPSMTPSRFVSDLSGIWVFALDKEGNEEKGIGKAPGRPLPGRSVSLQRSDEALQTASTTAGLLSTPISFRPFHKGHACSLP